MDKLSDMVDLPFFYSCTWHVMISNPGLRPPALNYLLRRLPKITNTEGTLVIYWKHIYKYIYMNADGGEGE